MSVAKPGRFPRDRYCPVANKKTYFTYGEALAVLDTLAPACLDAVTGLRNLIGSVYSCDSCGGWHVSSRKFTIAKRRGRGKRRRGVVKRVA
jgi:hypothetical protein